MAFAKRRHSIQIPQDYNLVTEEAKLRSSARVELSNAEKDGAEAESGSRSFRGARSTYYSTAKEAEIKSREVKDRLEGYVEQNKIASELLSFCPPIRYQTDLRLSGPSSAIRPLTSTGEVLRQRRHEVSNKRRMMEHHVDELIMQAGLKRPVHSRDHSSRPRQLKDSGLDASDTGNADHKQRKGTFCRKEKRKLKLVTEIEQDSQADEHDDEEEGADRR
ncbi:hypothetical protein PSHT_04787 [Puccinia striiformis]|uniref:Uncharacterized protein n=1 Tax=Puccinia striiformis TaxID=27350 RepID=A0A2S4WC85_9BASI|nr:hypothetical protein PSHT_04787 [Puccinia striiformis]